MTLSKILNNIGVFNLEKINDLDRIINLLNLNHYCVHDEICGYVTFGSFYSKVCEECKNHLFEEPKYFMNLKFYTINEFNDFVSQRTKEVSTMDVLES